MKTSIRAELRKMLSVRSTYFLVAITILLICFVGFYAQGFKLDAKSLSNPLLLNNSATDALSNLMLFAGLVALLLVTHEYRYNTIVYTLTANKSRSRVIAGKLIVMSGFALLFGAMVGFLAPLTTYLGVHAAHHADILAPQTINYGDLIWRVLYYSWGYVTLSLILAVIIRNQVAAIASLFVLPTIEALLSLLLKNNTVYLPINSLSSVVSTPMRGTITHLHAAEVSAIYLVVGWLIAWVTFVRRDAN